MTKRVWLFLALSILPATTSAQLVGGKVIAVTGRQPLAGVSVELRSVASDSALQTSTDPEGMFSFFLSKGGRYVLSFRQGVNVFAFPDTLSLTSDSVFQRLFVLEFPQPPEPPGLEQNDSAAAALSGLKARDPEDPL